MQARVRRQTRRLLAAVDNLVKTDADNPTIGLTLCKSADEDDRRKRAARPHRPDPDLRVPHPTTPPALPRCAPPGRADRGAPPRTADAHSTRKRHVDARRDHSPESLP